MCAYDFSYLFAEYYFRGLNNTWGPYKEHLLYHLSSKWLLDFLVSGESLQGIVLEKSSIGFEDVVSYSSIVWLRSYVLLCRFLSPLAAVPFITLTGLGLFARGFPQVRPPNFSFCYYLLHIIVVQGTTSSFIFSLTSNNSLSDNQCNS